MDVVQRCWACASWHDAGRETGIGRGDQRDQLAQADSDGKRRAAGRQYRGDVSLREIAASAD